MEPTPEQQDVYGKAVKAAMTVLYSDGTYEQVMEMLKNGAQQPVEALSKVAQIILLQVKEQSGGQVSPEIMKGVVSEVVALIAELAKEAGLFEVTPEQEQEAVQAVNGVVGPQEMTPEEGQAMQQQPPAGGPPAPPQGPPTAGPPQGGGLVGGAMNG